MASLGGANFYYGGTWAASSWNTSDGYGWAGFGSGRYLVLKVTASTASESLTGQFRVQVPIYCSSTVSSYPINCGVTTTAPSFSSAPSPPSSYVTSNVSVTTSYSPCVVYSPSLTITSGATYYVWLWSTSSYVGYHGHSGSTGYIYVVGMTNPSVSLSGYKGFYSGCTLSVNKSSYGYIYVGNGTYGTFYRKTTSGTSISIDADTSSTSKTVYVIRTDYDLGTDVYYGGGIATGFSVPRFACAVYNGSSSYTVYSGNSGTFTCSLSGYTFQGLATSSSTTSVSYSSGQYSTTFNGGVYYAVYTQSTSISYYRGSSTAYTAYPSRYLYGTGSYTSWALTEPTRTCATDGNYSFQGWSVNGNTAVNYSTLAAARIDGYTTVYGVYKKASSSSNTTVYYYRGSSTKNSVTKTTTVADAYYYGTGSHTGGGASYSYGSMTTTCASNSAYSLVGWATSSSSTSCDSTSATTTFNAGYTTIYGVYKKEASSSNSTVYYYRGTSTKNSVTKTTSVADAYYYGAGSHTGGGTTYSYGTIDTSCGVSGWTFLGFTTSSTTQQATSTAKALFDAGNTTIYGTYSLTETMTCYPQNGGNSESVSTTNYRYGAGSVTANTPAEPALTYDYHTLLGWGTSADDTSEETWLALWNAGTRTVYAIWKRDNAVFFGVDGEWEPSDVYYGVNGVWEPAISRYGDGEWK